MYEDFINALEEDDAIGPQHFLPAELRELYPNIAYALSGKPGSKKAKTKPQPPATISFRAADGGIRFTVTPQKAVQVLTGFIGEPGPILAQIEECLATGAYTKAQAWKR